MFNQDYIMRQVQQLTQVLNSILTQVLHLKKLESEESAVQYLDHEFLKELGFDLEEVLTIEDEEQLLSFLNKSGLNTENLNLLADILFEVADQNFENSDHHSKSLRLFSQSLFMYNFIEKNENIYSIDRNLKISRIKDVLN
tara:strand:+ start:40765 stop:41187 length:423 start_codon:yes stop_codon:yes gene_type:complete